MAKPDPAPANQALRTPGADRAPFRLGPVEISNGFIGFVFAATGPLAVILSVGTAGGLDEAQLASWVFAAFFINGVLSFVMSLMYRQPLCFFWTIPGTVLVGPAMKHLSFAEVVGAYHVTSLLILLLGVTGLAKQAMRWMPMPIVMGMVAGVFLRFGTDVVRALHGDVAIAGSMLVVFLLLSALPRLGRLLPPIIGALAIGVAVAISTARLDPSVGAGWQLVAPVVPTPVFSPLAMVELVVPLAITILIVQNSQGFAVLTAAGHSPPITAVTVACAVGGAASAAVGGVGTCLAGPTNAIITSSGRRERHFAAAIMTGCFAMAFGLAAPTFTSLMLAAPKELIMMLGGLAMLRVLQTAFMTSFKGPFAFGALVSFLVTVTDIPVLNIGAAFWGLIAGMIASLLLERSDFQTREPG